MDLTLSVRFGICALSSIILIDFFAFNNPYHLYHRSAFFPIMRGIPTTASDIFGRDFTASADALASKLIKGDMVAARIANFDRTRDPLITVSDRDLGKIDTGDLVSMSSSKIPRLIGKRGSMIQDRRGHRLYDNCWTERLDRN